MRIDAFASEFEKDKLIKREGTNIETYSFVTIVKIMYTDDNDLNDGDIGIKFKYDALLQALGQAMGNYRLRHG